jgi:multidrug efflux pump subunit AcrA (membrane-fusion protein)
VALNRLGGQYFAFVIEDAEGGTVARQRSVELGPVVGNDYLVLSGVEAGERLIVSGIQRVRDGAPVTIVTGRAPAPGAEGR